jgi:hypothetical protein
MAPCSLQYALLCLWFMWVLLACDDVRGDIHMYCARGRSSPALALGAIESWYALAACSNNLRSCKIHMKTRLLRLVWVDVFYIYIPPIQGLDMTDLDLQS